MRARADAAIAGAVGVDDGRQVQRHSCGQGRGLAGDLGDVDAHAACTFVAWRIACDYWPPE
jgi:hypothetical protein